MLTVDFYRNLCVQMPKGQIGHERRNGVPHPHVLRSWPKASAENKPSAQFQAAAAIAS